MFSQVVEDLRALELSNAELRRMGPRRLGKMVSLSFSRGIDKLRETDFAEEFTDKDALEMRRVVARAPVYAALALLAVTGLSIDQLVHNGKISRQSLFVKQQKITSDGRTISVWKLRTLPENSPQRASSLQSRDRISRWTKFLAATSLDELPQLVSILFGKMQYYSGRPLLGDDHARMRKVLTPEEYANWNRFLKDDLWSALHFPGCRALTPQSDEYLRARYLAAFIWSRMGSRAGEEYMMKVVDRYLLSTVVREGTDLVLGTGKDIADGSVGLLPDAAAARVRDIARPTLGGAAGWLGRLIRGAADRAAGFIYPVTRMRSRTDGTRLVTHNQRLSAHGGEQPGGRPTVASPTGESAYEASAPRRPAALNWTMGVPDPDARWDGSGDLWDRGPAPTRGQNRIQRLAQLNADGGGFARGAGQSSERADVAAGDGAQPGGIAGAADRGIYEVARPDHPAVIRPEGKRHHGVRRVTVEGGLFYDWNGDLYNTTGEGDIFLIDANTLDIRIAGDPEIDHSMVYSEYDDPEQGPIGLGFWKCVEGEIKRSPPAVGYSARHRRTRSSPLRSDMRSERRG